MKLKEFAKIINNYAKRYPESVIVYEIGNDKFLTVDFEPTEGKYDFLNKKFSEDVAGNHETNAICIN